MNSVDFVNAINRQIPSVKDLFSRYHIPHEIATEIYNSSFIKMRTEPLKVNTSQFDQIGILYSNYYTKGIVIGNDIWLLQEPQSIGTSIHFLSNEANFIVQTETEEIYLVDCYDFTPIQKCADNIEKFFDAVLVHAELDWKIKKGISISKSLIENSSINSAELSSSIPSQTLDFYKKLNGIF